MYNQGLWSAFFWLHNIKRISKFLSRDNLVAVIHAFIASRLDYWYSLLYDLPNIELAKLQRVQKAAARSVTTTRKYDQITPILCEFHCLPVKFRINFKILLLTFKALHGMTPNYIRDLLTIRAQGRYSLRSNSSIVLEVPRDKILRSFGHRSFSMAAPNLWNEVPLAMRDIPTRAAESQDRPRG